MNSSRPRIWRPDIYLEALDMDAGDRFVTHAIAGVGSRCIAGLVDFALSLLLAVIPYVLLVLPLGLRPAALAMSAVGLSAVFHTLLCWISEAVLDGQSPGKNICGLRVVSRAGHPPSPRSIAVRNLVRLLDSLPGCHLLGLTVMLTSGQTRRLGDLAGGTVVIYDDGLSAQLAMAGVPASVYSTSEDGYLLESFLAREERLEEPYRSRLAERLAEYLASRYPAAASAVPGGLRMTAPAIFLRRLHEAESGGAE